MKPNPTILMLSIAGLALGLGACDRNNSWAGGHDRPADRYERERHTTMLASERRDDRTPVREVSMAFPTGQRGSGMLLVEKRLPEHVMAGQEFEYDITVTNTSDMVLRDVRIVEHAERGEPSMGSGRDGLMAAPEREFETRTLEREERRIERRTTPGGANVDTSNWDRRVDKPTRGDDPRRLPTGGVDPQRDDWDRRVDSPEHGDDPRNLPTGGAEPGARTWDRPTDPQRGGAVSRTDHDLDGDVRVETRVHDEGMDGLDIDVDLDDEDGRIMAAPEHEFDREFDLDIDVETGEPDALEQPADRQGVGMNERLPDVRDWDRRTDDPTDIPRADIDVDLDLDADQPEAEFEVETETEVDTETTIRTETTEIETEVQTDVDELDVDIDADTGPDADLDMDADLDIRADVDTDPRDDLRVDLDGGAGERTQVEIDRDRAIIGGGDADTTITMEDDAVITEQRTRIREETGGVMATPERSLDQPAARDPEARQLPRDEEWRRGGDERHAAMERVHEIGTLQPGESRTITVRHRAEGPGMLSLCTEAVYTPVLCATTMVIAPQLTVTKVGPEEGMIGDDLVYTIQVTNTGVGPASNVELIDSMPQGLVGSDGNGEQFFEVGTLRGGETKEYTVRARATEPGRFCNTVTARASGGLSDTAEVCTQIRGPRLEVAKSSPEQAHTNAPIQFRITVYNSGDAPAQNVVIRDTLPEGARFIGAENGGEVRDREVHWSIGTLQPGEARTVVVDAEGLRAGELENCVFVDARGIGTLQDCATVRLLGVTGLLLVLVDQNDPVRVGQEEIYSIRVINQGEAPATNITIDAILEDTMEFVSVSRGEGELGRRAPELTGREGGTLRFGPIAELGPREEAGWRVVVRAMGEGDTRFRIVMNADQLDRPVHEEESTRVVDAEAVPAPPTALEQQLEGGGRPPADPRDRREPAPGPDFQPVPADEPDLDEPDLMDEPR